jgi:hypothetical protein
MRTARIKTEYDRKEGRTKESYLRTEEKRDWGEKAKDE